MQLSMVIKPLTEENLKIAKQIGIDNVIDYNLNFPDDADEHIAAVRKTIEPYGLRLAGIEGSPAQDDILFGRFAVGYLRGLMHGVGMSS
ncbi:MAG: hypothetical protein NTW86_14715 [Candidatus Sumerlaeota bacterium]|nr:hypothetical protein [Candidatus Sumerlaeota bacterium]